MARTTRRTLVYSLLLAAASCTSPAGPATTGQAPANAAAAPAAQPVAAAPTTTQADEAWLAEFRQRLAGAREGQAPTTAAQPAGQAQVTQAPVTQAPVMPVPVAAPMTEPAPAPVTQPAPAPVSLPAQEAPASIPAAAPVASIKDGDLAQLMAESRVHATLIDDRMAKLVAAFLDRGVQQMKDGNLASAHDDFANAYELDPDDPAARDLYFRTGALLGKPVADLPVVAATATDRAGARADQARQLLRQAVEEGNRSMNADDPEAALQSYQNALTLLRAHPDIATPQMGEADIVARIAVAKRAAADSAQHRDEKLAAIAMQNSAKSEAAVAERDQLRTRQLMDAANQAFLKDDYDGTEAALAEVLRIDPANVEAESLRRVSQRARHERTGRKTRDEFRQEWQDTFDELEQDSIPQTDLVVFPDAKDWDEISVRGDKRFGGGEQAATSDIDEAVRQALEKRIPVDFQDEPLEQVLEHLKAVTGVNFVPSQTVRDAGLSKTYNLQDRNAQPVSRILSLLLEDLSESPLTYTVRDGVVRILAKDEARHDYVLQMYDIRDLTFTPKDYPSQDYNLLPSGIDADSYRSGVEDDEPLPLIGGDALLSLIQDNISPDSWSSDPERTIQLMPGTLVVRQTPEVHAQIRQLLEDLRRNTKTLIHIETRFIEVEDSFLEDIGVDLRGLDGSLTGGFPLEDFGQSGAGGFGTPGNPVGIGTGNDPGFFYAGNKGDIKGRIENLYDYTLGEPGTINGLGGLSVQALFLDDTNVQAVLHAVTKYQTSNIVNAPSLTLRSGQRGNVKAITIRTYVRDFEPEIAQAAVIAQPELDNVKNGVALDVRAVASADLRFITLELRPTVIDLVPGPDGNDLPTKTVSLATQNSSDVTIELPELRIQRLRTTATIPDGATLMLGGLKRSVEQDQNSGVPFLSDIPILGAMFSRQGEYTSKRKLIILLKASILRPEESEPRSVGQR